MKPAANFLTFFRMRIPIKVLVAVLAASGLCPAASIAQVRRGAAAEGGRCPARGEIEMDERTVMDVAAAILHLTDAQKQQAQMTFDAAVRAAVPVVVQMQNSQNILFEAVKAGKSDDEIKSLADQQGSLRGQLLLLQAQTFSKLWAVLTPDQRDETGILIYDGIGQFLSNAHALGATDLPSSNLPNTNHVAPSPPAPQSSPNPARP